LLAAVLLSSAVVGADNTPTSAPVAATESMTAPVPAPIPLPQIAPAAADLGQLLTRFATDLGPGGAPRQIQDALPQLAASLEVDAKETADLLAGQPSLQALQSQERIWSERRQRLTLWLETVTARVTGLQDALTRLETLDETWTLTRSAAVAAGYPASISTVIDRALAAIAVSLPIYHGRRDEALAVQAQLAELVGHCEAARNGITTAQQTVEGGTFARDSRPLWSAALWHEGLAAIPARLAQIAADYRVQVVTYLTDPGKRLPVHLALFVVALTALLAARARLQHWNDQGRDLARIAAVVERPIAAAALLGLMAATSVTSPAPPLVKDLLGALALLPMILIARPFAEPAARPALYTLGLLFALDRVRHAFGGVPAMVDQAAIFVESLAGALALGWLFLHLRSRIWQRKTATLDRALRVLGTIALVMLGIGLVASLLGFTRLAALNTPAVLAGGATALFFYAVVEIAVAAFAFALRVRPLRRLYLVRNHRERLVIRAAHLFKWLAIGGWCIRYLDYLGLLEPATTAMQASLTARLTLGAFSTSLGDVLAFSLTLIGAHLLSRALRFVLDEEVFPRAGVSTGISYATSSLIQYCIAILALLIALGFLGVTLNQVTVFAGALGVGVGLGLQGVVQNFVAGLILLFEQPIHVGDAVQIGDMKARVRRIGIRASVVRTSQGAEVIIPNSELTSNKVTNWTLSDQQERLEIPVGLAYGTDQEQAIALIEGVARVNPRVLAEPAPVCLFMSYGDSSINFELRAWTNYDVGVKVRSELTTAIYAAVNAAGLCFPFPQREVRLLSNDPAVVVPTGIPPGVG
jgi:potassium-dependent mechanosensitive channel